MRVCVLDAILCLFVAVITATEAKIELEIGQTFDLKVQTIPHEIDGCFIKTPQDEVIELKPNDESDKNKYKLLKDNAFTSCQVELTVTDRKDNGLWSIYFTENEKVVKTEEYDLTVKSSDAEEETLTQDITWLTPIEYIVNKGMMVEISLSRKDDVLACSLTTPRQAVIHENEEQNGINFFKTNSDLYTSCRVQIGPINDETLLGDWTLCSQRLIADETIQECQTASISWNNGNMIDESQSKFNHPVHFGGNFTLTVKHYGDVKSCHVITPSGNDLTILEDSKFPYITRTAPFTQCNVAIGPVDWQCIGDWTLYGIFTSFSGVTVVTLPTSFSLYNELNPVDQAYNVTNREPILKITNTLSTIELEVTGRGNVDSCDITPPENADIENNVISIENIGSCRYSVGPITENMLGDWLVTGKFSRNDIHSEIRQVFTIKQEDPYNPEVDSNRVVRYLESKRFETSLGEIHEVVIRGDETFRIVESCHVKIPDGRQYSVIEGFNITGVEVEKGTDCALKITVASKDMTGEWALIARKSDLGLPVEERLNFTIYIEEQVEAVPSQVTIHEFDDLFVRLRDKTEFYETCKLYSPEGDEYLDFEVNPEYYDYCGFIVKNVEEKMNGTWHIVYDDGIVYRASIAVNIVRKTTIDFPDLTWEIDDKIDVYVGPENIYYCRVMDSSGDIVFEGFGQCRITISRVLSAHEGIWLMVIGQQGKIVAEVFQFYVRVQEPTEYKPKVITKVQTLTNPPSVSLYCSVETSHPSEQLCKFRSPLGDVLIASEGLMQLRYMAVGSGTVNNSGVYQHTCGLRISNIFSVDTGIWSCAIATTNDTYYGFLTVLAEANNVIPGPKLVSNKDSVTAVVGDEVIMSCSTQTNIHYCYFRKDDGTVYNLVPGISSDVEYFGAGFDAGECGIKFKTRNVQDSGQWTCNVGTKDTFSEMKTVINMNVYDELTLKQYINGKVMVVNATAMQHHDADVLRVDYCRYVRSDGFSFTSQALPFRFMASQITGSTCVLLISQLTTPDYYPWTVTMKMKGRTKELTGVTSLYIPYYYYYWNSVALWLWLTITILGLSLIVLGFSLGPKKNRDWTLTRVRTIRNSIRSSIRSSIRKAPLKLPSIIDDKPPAYSAE